MIVSHKHKFIFMKTLKTASSSVEIALSNVLGPDDIITPTRSDLAGQRASDRAARNYRSDHPAVPKRPLIKRLLRRPERHYHPSIGFYEHMPAWRAKLYLGDEIWNAYYKFSFERNPWDRQVSLYFYKTRGKTSRPRFEEFMKKKKSVYIWNSDIYMIDGRSSLDFVGKYENLDKDFGKALKAIGLDGAITLPEANTSAKPKNSSYRDFYTPATRQGGRNYRSDHPAVPKRPLIKRLLRRPERHYHPSIGFYEHMPAWRAKLYLGDEIWNAYYKFSFERNPWDRQVSLYFYKTRGKTSRPRFEEFMKKKKSVYIWNSDIYMIDGRSSLDFVGKYENLDKDFGKALKAIGLDGAITLPEANTSAKPKNSSYRDFYTPATRQMVADWYAPEIELFGYEF